jgi:hypothetical protein
VTELIQRAIGKRDDPIPRDWALDRYHDARHVDPRRPGAMEEAWFDGLRLRR